MLSIVAFLQNNNLPLLAMMLRQISDGITSVSLHENVRVIWYIQKTPSSDSQSKVKLSKSFNTKV